MASGGDEIAARFSAIAARKVGAIVDSIGLLLAGLFAGFFYTFSISVVRGFGIVDNATYVESFQAINATIRNVAFGTVFFGLLPVLILAAVIHRKEARKNVAIRLLAISLVVATVAITFLGNVPLNETLATVDSTNSVEAEAARADFEDVWNQLNLWRSILSFGALACLAFKGKPSI